MAERSFYGLYVGDNRLLIQSAWGAKLLVPADDLSLTPELACHGFIEPALTLFLAQYLQPGQTAVDVGAHVGYFTVLMAQRVGPAGRVLAYEPNPHTFPFLADNVAINYVQEQCELLQKAAHSTDGSLVFHCARRFTGNSSVHPHSEQYFRRYPDAVERAEVPCERLDARLASLGRVALLKLDIEGGEYHALVGIEPLLAAGAVGVVVFEINRAMLGGDWDVFCRLLRRFENAGAVFSTIAAEGHLTPVALERLLASGSHPHAVMEFRPAA